MNKIMEYDSYAYKTMVFMDVLTDIDKDWKTRFDSSEDMFGELTDLLLNHDKWDKENGHDIGWYSSVQMFLKASEVG
jgi:hypothetical protein|tara:strand:+ start:1271 stop:1501 length:231 start_codon:yes stop_codon:yes gene_type:complete